MRGKRIERGGGGAFRKGDVVRRRRAVMAWRIGVVHLQVNTPIFQFGLRIAVLGVCLMVMLASIGAAAGDAAKPGAELSLSLDGGRLSLAARDR